MANTKLHFLNQHTSPAKHVSHSFTHSHTLSCDWICPTYIQTYIHTLNTADGAEASTLPSLLLFLVPASCLGWPLSSPSHLNNPDTWLDCTTWSSGAGGAQQHLCCLCDRVGSTASLYTPLLQLCDALAWLQCMQKCWRMFWERDRERETPSEAKIEVIAETSIWTWLIRDLAHLNKHQTITALLLKKCVIYCVALETHIECKWFCSCVQRVWEEFLIIWGWLIRWEQ